MAPDLTIGSKPPVAAARFKFGEDSVRKFRSIHPDLVTLTCEALACSQIDFGIARGALTPNEQIAIVKARASHVLDSRHVVSNKDEGGNGYAHAICAYVYVVVNGEQCQDWALFSQIDLAFEHASRRTGIPYVWFGRWKRKPEGRHFELPLDLYPKNCVVTDAQRSRAAAALAKVST